VDTIFGFPGGAVLNIYEELYRSQNEIRHILTSHEQGAAHAADGYARATGKVGVCLATSGPGHKSGYRNSNRLHGFGSDGCNYRTGGDAALGQGFLPGS